MRGRVPLERIDRFVRDCLAALGVPAPSATTVADVFVRATARGVGHHDISDLPSRLEWLDRGLVSAGATPRVVDSTGAVSVLDARNCLGELATSHLVDVTRADAARFGIAYGVVANSNHFLAAFPYVQRIVEGGCIGIVMSRTLPSMGVPGLGKKVLGNNPLGYGVPAAGGDLLFDASLAYASWGELDRRSRDGQPIPHHWALDSDNQPTGDPAAALEGAAMPIGDHKGVALSLLVEVLTSVIGGGSIVDERSRDGEISMLHSQSAIVIDLEVVQRLDEVTRRVEEMRVQLDALAPALRLPGDRSRDAIGSVARDGVELSDGCCETLDAWADRLEVEPLTGQADADIA